MKVNSVYLILILVSACNNPTLEEKVTFVAEQPIKKDTSESELAYNKGYENYNKRDYRGAVKEFTKYIDLRRGKEKISSSDYEIYYLRAEANRAINKYNNAVHDYDIFLNYCPQDSTRKKGYFGRGSAQMGLEWYAGAENDFSNVIELDPQNSDAYYCRGLIRAINNNQFQACEDYSKAAQLGNNKAKEMLNISCNNLF